MQALGGTLVVDFTRYLPGAFASSELRRLGARVVRIERPGGDPMRQTATDWHTVLFDTGISPNGMAMNFERLGLETYECESDVGMMGGSGAHEYLAPCEVGENSMALCERGDYYANVEVATGVPSRFVPPESRDREDAPEFQQWHRFRQS